MVFQGLKKHHMQNMESVISLHTSNQEKCLLIPGLFFFFIFETFKINNGFVNILK